MDAHMSLTEGLHMVRATAQAQSALLQQLIADQHWSAAAFILEDLDLLIGRLQHLEAKLSAVMQ